MINNDNKYHLQKMTKFKQFIRLVNTKNLTNHINSSENRYYLNKTNLTKHKNISILGEAFSFNQSWIEGGLKMVSELLISQTIDLSAIIFSYTIIKNLKYNFKNLLLIRKNELLKHNNENTAWTTIKHSKTGIYYVYDLTDWIIHHPGGSLHIISIAGKDGTELFYKQNAHPFTKIEAYILPKYIIGIYIDY